MVTKLFHIHKKNGLKWELISIGSLEAYWQGANFLKG